MTSITATALRAVRIDVDGTATTTGWQGPDDSLEHLQHAVGGYVEVVRLHPSLDMWVDEEGLIKNLPLNPVASLVAIIFGAAQACYAGLAVFTGGVDRAGVIPGLDDDQVAALTHGAAVAKEDLRL